ncbi:MAG TPA: GAF domain-containing sensor histidine kinase [Gemmatimonadales bacterium]|nr:GAF domain-containing sensor histidine kinase [Gemmatimonadales bacterium]
MQGTPLPSHAIELDAALLQAAITAALAALCGFLYARYRKAYFGWWSAAWGLYFLRIAAITSFLLTDNRFWLYGHQVATGWTALALLYAALVFSQQIRWRRWFLVLVLFPPVWSYVAIYQLDHFLWAAGPAVLFLSLATLWTSWVFVRYRMRVTSSGATLLAVAFGLWGLHHLDYPFLRARGSWAPWGYYLDILFELAVGAGILLIVLDDLRRGLAAMSTLSGDLQRAGKQQDVLEVLLARPLTLPAVSGTALYLVNDSLPHFAQGAGVCASWTGGDLSSEASAVLHRVIGTGRPQFSTAWSNHNGEDPAFPYAAVLPILRQERVVAALVLVGQARDPFTALDERFLLALGNQVGAALENADLYSRLESRTVELARLSSRMVEQHEEERRRLSRELHDETAQVFSAVKMELGLLRERVQPEASARLDHVLGLIDTGIRSIRNVTNDLRPSLLDDLGLLPALRSLVADFSERSGLQAQLTAPATLPPLSGEAELALFRALQEALANVLRHADARGVTISILVNGGSVLLQVRDDGRGLPPDWSPERLEMAGHMGLAGMRERITALGGSVRLQPLNGAGALLEVLVPSGRSEQHG